MYMDHSPITLLINPGLYGSSYVLCETVVVLMPSVLTIGLDEFNELSLYHNNAKNSYNIVIS